MSYISLFYDILILATFLIYYITPKKYRYVILSIGSIVFYIHICTHPVQIAVFASSIVFAYLFGLLITRCVKLGADKEKSSRKYALQSKLFLAIGIVLAGMPLYFIRFTGTLGILDDYNFIVPLGISFYTLQIISYLVDIYRGVAKVIINPVKFILYMSFFPQIIQGPIPRYSQLADQLFEGHDFDEKEALKGLQLILWGYFLKLMIADKAGIVVDNIFGHYTMYSGGYIFHAGLLYSIQLYADFMACVCISQGVARLFGIRLADNFNRPYFAETVQEFWRRWHMSLSGWLRDYVYIPLGGNRKGKFRKYLNTIITFLVSGIWHGGDVRYIVWGLMHGIYIVFGSLTSGIRDKITRIIMGKKDDSDEFTTLTGRLFRRACTFIFVMIAWIIFRADTLQIGIGMLYRMFTTFSPFVYFDSGIYNLGLDEKQTHILVFSIIMLFVVSYYQEKHRTEDIIMDKLLKQPRIMRWGLYIVAIIAIWVFGTYGYGYNASDFIYGGF